VYAIGRRKTAVARVRLYESAKQSITINKKDCDAFFATDVLRRTVRDAFIVSQMGGKYRVEASVNGGGVTGQAEAIRLGIARALISINTGLRKDLKKVGYLKRDPRANERRKFGLKKARKSPQWSKR
jgi:small subunit ribosomal protein S9